MDCVLCEIGPVIIHKLETNVGLKIVKVVYTNILENEIKPYPFITYYCADMYQDVPENKVANTLRPRTLFWPRSRHHAWTAVVYIRPARSNH
jgi:hypothetical protein